MGRYVKSALYEKNALEISSFENGLRLLRDKNCFCFK
jgi:hypothetical protein